MNKESVSPSKLDSPQKSGSNPVQEPPTSTPAGAQAKASESYSQLQILALTHKGISIFHPKQDEPHLACEVDFADSVGVFKHAGDSHVVVYSNEEVKVFTNEGGSLNEHFSASLPNSKHLWFSSEARFLCVVYKPDKNYFIKVFDLDQKKKVSFLDFFPFGF